MDGLVSTCKDAYKVLQNMMAHIRDNLQEILHTREGSKVAMICISYASPKVRQITCKRQDETLIYITIIGS